MRVRIEVEGKTPDEIVKYTEILTILLEKGALDGVKGGSTILHFDGQGIFQGVELDYWPWRRRKSS